VFLVVSQAAADDGPLRTRPSRPGPRRPSRCVTGGRLPPGPVQAAT